MSTAVADQLASVQKQAQAHGITLDEASVMFAIKSLAKSASTEAQEINEAIKSQAQEVRKAGRALATIDAGTRAAIIHRLADLLQEREAGIMEVSLYLGWS